MIQNKKRYTILENQPQVVENVKKEWRQRMNIENTMLVAASIFCIGLYGFLTSQNVVRILMSLELLLNAINLNLVSFSTIMDSQELKGQVFALFIITIAAAESAIALAIILSLYRNKESISMEQFNLLKW